MAQKCYPGGRSPVHRRGPRLRAPFLAAACGPTPPASLPAD